MLLSRLLVSSLLFNICTADSAAIKESDLFVNLSEPVRISDWSYAFDLEAAVLPDGHMVYSSSSGIRVLTAEGSEVAEKRFDDHRYLAPLSSGGFAVLWEDTNASVWTQVFNASIAPVTAQPLPAAPWKHDSYTPLSIAGLSNGWYVTTGCSGQGGDTRAGFTVFSNEGELKKEGLVGVAGEYCHSAKAVPQASGGFVIIVESFSDRASVYVFSVDGEELRSALLPAGRCSPIALPGDQIEFRCKGSDGVWRFSAADGKAEQLAVTDEADGFTSFAAVTGGYIGVSDDGTARFFGPNVPEAECCVTYSTDIPTDQYLREAVVRAVAADRVAIFYSTTAGEALRFLQVKSMEPMAPVPLTVSLPRVPATREASAALKWCGDEERSGCTGENAFVPMYWCTPFPKECTSSSASGLYAVLTGDPYSQVTVTMYTDPRCQVESDSFSLGCGACSSDSRQLSLECPKSVFQPPVNKLEWFENADCNGRGVEVSPSDYLLAASGKGSFFGSIKKDGMGVHYVADVDGKCSDAAPVAELGVTIYRDDDDDDQEVARATVLPSGRCTPLGTVGAFRWTPDSDLADAEYCALWRPFTLPVTLKEYRNDGCTGEVISTTQQNPRDNPDSADTDPCFTQQSDVCTQRPYYYYDYRSGHAAGVCRRLRAYVIAIACSPEDVLWAYSAQYDSPLCTGPAENERLWNSTAFPPDECRAQKNSFMQTEYSPEYLGALCQMIPLTKRVMPGMFYEWEEFQARFLPEAAPQDNADRAENTEEKEKDKGGSMIIIIVLIVGGIAVFAAVVGGIAFFHKKAASSNAQMPDENL